MINKQRQRKAFWPILIIFILTNAILVTGKRWSVSYKIDFEVLLIGNLVLMLATMFSFMLYRRSLDNNQPQAFLRYIYSGMFLKMIICLVAALVYIFAFDGKVNKPALFGCMFLYFVYTFVEVSILLRLSKQQKNVQTGSPS